MKVVWRGRITRLLGGTGVLQLVDTNIPQDVLLMRMESYHERYTGPWYWHPPHHILCLKDDRLPAAQKGRREWISYDPNTQKDTYKNGG